MVLWLASKIPRYLHTKSRKFWLMETCIAIFRLLHGTWRLNTALMPRPGSWWRFMRRRWPQNWQQKNSHLIAAIGVANFNFSRGILFRFFFFGQVLVEIQSQRHMQPK